MFILIDCNSQHVAKTRIVSEMRRTLHLLSVSSEQLDGVDLEFRAIMPRCRIVINKIFEREKRWLANAPPAAIAAALNTGSAGSILAARYERQAVFFSPKVVESRQVPRSTPPRPI